VVTNKPTVDCHFDEPDAADTLREEKSRFSTEEEISRFARNDKREFFSNLLKRQCMRINAQSRMVAILCVLILSSVGLLAGCSSSKKMTAPKGKDLREYEKDFDPSKYRSSSSGRKPADPSYAPAPKPQTEVEHIERFEKVMGYKIQLYSTTDLDDAERMKEKYQGKFDSLSIRNTDIAVEYDAPYYKIRIGNFLQKKTADSMKENLKSYGMNEAWVVRTNVLQATKQNN
jgi:hypothetical protein